MLEILPFHLKRLLQSSIGSLRIPLGSLGKLMNTQQPMVYFGEEPRVKLGRFSNKAPKIAVTSTYGNSKSGEECLSSQLMRGRNHKNTLGGLWKIAIGGA